MWSCRDVEICPERDRLCVCTCEFVCACTHMFTYLTHVYSYTYMWSFKDIATYLYREGVCVCKFVRVCTYMFT